MLRSPVATRIYFVSGCSPFPPHSNRVAWLPPLPRSVVQALQLQRHFPRTAACSPGGVLAGRARSRRPRSSGGLPGAGIGEGEFTKGGRGFLCFWEGAFHCPSETSSPKGEGVQGTGQSEGQTFLVTNSHPLSCICCVCKCSIRVQAKFSPVCQEHFNL